MSKPVAPATAKRMVMQAPRLGLAFCVALFGALLAGAASPAADMAVPAEVQHPLFLKILSYDRNLERRAGSELVFGIAYQGRYRPSVTARDAFVRAAEASAVTRINGIPVRYVPVEASTPAALARAVERHELDVLYVCPLRAFDVRAIAAVSRSAQVATLTGVPGYVSAGLAASIDAREGRPEIVINLPAARAEGIKFNAKLLKLVRIVSP